MIKKLLKKLMPRKKHENKILFESAGLFDNGYILFNYVKVMAMILFLLKTN